MKVDVLAFGAHPDDVEIGMGATLIKLIESGKKVALIHLTCGDKGTYGTPEIREREFRKFLKFVRAIGETLDFKDCEIEDNYKNRLKIADVIRKYKPQIVFSPYYSSKFTHKDGAAHPDHITTGNLVRFGLRYAKFKNIKRKDKEHLVSRLFYYMVPKDKLPTFVVDVSDHIKKWEKALHLYKSQMIPFNRDRELFTILKSYKILHGSLVGCKFGEGFLSEEPLNINEENLFEI